MKAYCFFLLSLFSLNIFSNLSIGSIEEVFIKNGSYERKIQIYNPFGKTINTDTTFIIMNDGEELFSEEDSWNGMSWNCLLYTSPSPRDRTRSRMPSSA